MTRLTSAAKARGIRVILDTSLNHTGSDSLYFDRYANFPGTGAFENAQIRPDSPYADWYRFFPDQTEPDRQYAGWVGVPTLPELTESDNFKDFAFRNPDSVMNTWLDRGTAGWRMDVAPWVQRPVLAGMADLDQGTPARRADRRGDVVRLLQVLPRRHLRLHHELHLPQRGHRLRQRPQREAAYQSIELMREAYPPQAFYALMNLLSTHDAARTLYEFGYTDTSNPQQIAQAKQRFRLAVLFQMTFPGSPGVFYGDEVGVTGGADPFNRATYPWADKGGLPTRPCSPTSRR